MKFLGIYKLIKFATSIYLYEGKWRLTSRHRKTSEEKCGLDLRFVPLVGSHICNQKKGVSNMWILLILAPMVQGHYKIFRLLNKFLLYSKLIVLRCHIPFHAHASKVITK